MKTAEKWMKWLLENHCACHGHVNVDCDDAVKGAFAACQRDAIEATIAAAMIEMEALNTDYRHEIAAAIRKLAEGVKS